MAPSAVSPLSPAPVAAAAIPSLLSMHLAHSHHSLATATVMLVSGNAPVMVPTKYSVICIKIEFFTGHVKKKTDLKTRESEF